MTQKLSTHNKREKWGGTSGYSLENKSRVPGLSGGETTPSGGRACLFFLKGQFTHYLLTTIQMEGRVKCLSPQNTSGVNSSQSQYN